MPATYGTVDYGPYIELDELRQWVQLANPNMANANDFALQKLIGMACTWAQRWLGRPIARTLFQPPLGRFDGGSGLNSTWIILPYAPVLEVVSVTEYQGSTPVALSEIDPSTGGDGYVVDYQTGLLTRIMGGIFDRPWMPSTQGVLVEWYAGFNPVPDDIWVATAELVLHWFRNTQQVAGMGGSIRPDFDPSTDAPNGLWAGIPNRIINLLTPYRQVTVA